MASFLKLGRPKWKVEQHRIRLQIELYHEWIIEKELNRLAQKTDSEFAAYFLQILNEKKNVAIVLRLIYNYKTSKSPLKNNSVEFYIQ